MGMSRVLERRTGQDRRQLDALAPGKMDRRRRVEARKPEIVEIELSETEWENLFGAGRPGLSIPQARSAISGHPRIQG